jgi:hypothetical protein
VPEDALEEVPDGGNRAEEVEIDVGHARNLSLDAAGIDGAEEVAGQAEGEEVDGEAAHDLVGAEMDREERVDQREQPAEEHGHEQAHEPRAAPHGAPDAEEGAGEHHPLEADVHDA